MFDKTIVFTGKHAAYLRELAAGNPANKTKSNLQKGNKHCPFQTNKQVFIIAPIVGFLYKRSSPVDADKNIPDNKIFAEQLNDINDQLELIYRTIMLLDKPQQVSMDERLNRAFRYDRNIEKREAGDEVFNGYVRGGIEVLYENLVANVNNEMDAINDVTVFVETCKEHFINEGYLTSIFALCKDASI